MLTRRELVLIFILLFLIVGGGSFVFYFNPTYAEIQTLRDSLEDRRTEFAEAQTRELQYEIFSVVLEGHQDEWSHVVASVPYEFDYAVILRRLQRIIYPHTYDLQTSFSTATSGDRLWASTVSVGFTTTRARLNTILTALENDALGNRVINYSVAAISEYGQDGELSIQLAIEYLTLPLGGQ